MPMTRVEAICACRNIVGLCDENNAIPEEMCEGVRKRATDMMESITLKKQYARVTENMDRALRNMWNGLRRWDRDDNFNTDLFDELEEVKEEVADLDASGQGPGPKGREGVGALSPEAPPAEARVLTLVPPTTTVQTRNGPVPVTDIAPGMEVLTDHDHAAVLPSSAPALSLTEILRRKEAALSFVYEELRKAAITVMDKVTIRHLSLSDVIGMTKSDRTQQLLRAAYYIGMLRGVGLMYNQLQDDL